MTPAGERAGTVSVRSEQAFARRARARRWLRLRLLLALLAVLAVVAAAGWVVLASPLLAVRQVRVQVRADGSDRLASRLDPAQIRALAAVPIGTPLARLDLAAIRARLHALPGVAGVRVIRSWPRTVVLDVTARTPAAAVPVGSSYELVDDTGVAFQRLPKAPAGLPVIQPGAADRAGSLRAALGVLAALPGSLRSTILQVSAPTAEQVTLRLRGGRIVVWGGVERSTEKVLVLQALLKHPAAVYDVSAPDAPTTRTSP